MYLVHVTKQDEEPRTHVIRGIYKKECLVRDLIKEATQTAKETRIQVGMIIQDISIDGKNITQNALARRDKDECR